MPVGCPSDAHEARRFGEQRHRREHVVVALAGVYEPEHADGQWAVTTPSPAGDDRALGADRQGDHLTRDPEQLRQRWVDDRMVQAGRSRAASVGYPDAYAFTKALAEKALGETKG